MKFIEERTAYYPPHALCKADIKIVMKAIPPAWIADIVLVRLSATLDRQSITHYNSYDRTLIIATRGKSKQAALNSILTELCAKGLEIPYQRWHQLTTKDRTRIDRIIGPITNILLPLLSRKKIWLDERPPGNKPKTDR